jgi:hypothetical protein
MCCILPYGNLSLLVYSPKLSETKQSEGLRAARLLMVLSGMSPLFILWAIRGSKIVPNRYLVTGCAVIVVLPSLFLWLRMGIAVKRQVQKELVVGTAEDHRADLLVYLFAMLLPFYSIDTNNWRDFAALVTAVGFVVFLFWNLNLHYLNIIFALRGYRVFTIASPADENPLSSRIIIVLITPRTTISSGEHIVAYRLSDNVYFEVKKWQTQSNST